MSKRRAVVLENEFTKAKKRLLESNREGSSLKRELAASRRKAATLEAANDVHVEEAEENRLSLAESQKDVRYWRARADHLTSVIERLKLETQELKSDKAELIERLKTEAQELKSDRERLRSANEKLESDYEQLRQWADLIMASCPIQGSNDNEARRAGNAGIDQQLSEIERVTGGAEEINEEMQNENMLQDEEDELEQQDNEAVEAPIENAEADSKRADELGDGEHEETDSVLDRNRRGQSEFTEQQPLSDENGSLEAENNALPRCDFELSKFGDNQEVINLSNRRVEVIPDLSRFSKLDTLYMRSNLLAGISDRLPRTLVSLHLSNNKIEEIRGLDALVNLEDLFLSDNRLRKIQGLSNLVNLRLLTLNNNMISRIEGLDGLRDLRHLDLSNNKIRRIKNMDRLTNLESLIISHNPVKKLANLDTLTRLTTLLMNALAIESFNGIQKLANLTTIHANGNAITSLDHLGQLGCLKSLWVMHNKISSWSEVEKLAKLPSLKSVALKGNPVEAQDSAVYLASALFALPQVESIDGTQ